MESELGATDSCYATREEAADALAALADEDIVRLTLEARMLWRSRSLRDSWGSPEDLLNAAIIQTVAPDEGGKRWRKNLPFVLHLRQAMRNLSGHVAGREQRRASKRSHELQAEAYDPQDHAGKREPENAAIAKDLLYKLREHFGEDVEAFEWVCYRAQGMTESEAASAAGIDKRWLSAVARRARRKVAAFKQRRNSP